MTLHKIPCIDGDEFDAFTVWRKKLHLNPRVLKKIKRKYNKRVRQKVKALIELEYNEYCKSKLEG